MLKPELYGVRVYSGLDAMNYLQPMEKKNLNTHSRQGIVNDKKHGMVGIAGENTETTLGTVQAFEQTNNLKWTAIFTYPHMGKSS